MPNPLKRAKSTEQAKNSKSKAPKTASNPFAQVVKDPKKKKIVKGGMGQC